MNRNVRHACTAAFLTVLSGTAAAVVPAATPFGPTPYTARTDSPFHGLAFSYFHLDDFEQGSTPQPGYASTTGGVILPLGPNTDSVAEDINPLTGAGRSWFSNGATNKFTFAFDAAALGTLPTHAGIVWTDVGNVSAGSIGVGDVVFTAFDATGNALPSINAIGLGNGTALSSTADDRFFGMHYAGGISRIEIAMPASVDWEVDHLQYGALNPVPEPEQWLLIAVGLAAVGVRCGKRPRKL